MAEHEQKHRDFMSGCLSRHEKSADHVAGIRCGLGDAAHLADAIGRDILVEHRGRRGKGKPTKHGKELAALAKRIGDAIWAARQETYDNPARAAGIPVREIGDG